MNTSLANDQCSATGCKNAPIKSVREIGEIPAWRHPADLLGTRAFEPIALAYYCAEHKANALEINNLVVRGQPVPVHVAEFVG